MRVVDALANIPRRIQGIFRRRRNREDYFTRLPDTCLLEIFKHLTRKDLDNLKGVNKKIHSVSNDKSLDKIKWEQGGLYICQSERGYSFEVRIRKDAKKKRFTSYQYEIYKSEDGYFIEERKLQYLNNFKYPFKVAIFEEHYSPIPDKFFTTLYEFLRSHEAMCVEIIQLPFESHFLSKLHLVLRGHNVKSLTCWSLKCEMNKDPGDKNMDPMDPIRQSFTQLIKGIPIVEMKAMDNIPSLIINEQFLVTVGASGMIAFISDIFPQEYYQYKFNVSESFLPYLLKFHSLKAAGMILNTNWVVNLIMDYLNEEEEFNKREEIFNKMSDPIRVDFIGWEFAVDRPITSQLIKHQIRAAQFQYSLLPTLNDEKHSIVNTRNNMRAILSPFVWEVEDGAATFHVVTVEFLRVIES